MHRSWDTEVFILTADSRQGLMARVEQLRRFLATAAVIAPADLAYSLNSQLSGPEALRLAIVASSIGELDRKLTFALGRLDDPAISRIKERSGIYFFDEPLGKQGQVAFLFPGEGSQYTNMLIDLCIHFPEVRAWFDLIDQVFISHERNYLPSQVIFPPTADRALGQEKRLWQMDCATEAVFTANQALFTLLSHLGIQPQAILGHSTGDYSALYAAGALQFRDEGHLIEHLRTLNGVYALSLSEGRIPEGALLAVGAPDRELVKSVVKQSNDHLYVAMDNCPHQVVLCGTQLAIEKAMEELGKAGAICDLLPYNRPYHTPMFTRFSKQLGRFYEQLKLHVPVIKTYSCATTRPYPDEPDEVRRIAIEQWARPVRFRETIEAMYEAGARIFVEVGARGNLTAFVDDILRGRPYLAVPTNLRHRSGITQINHLVGLLSAHGVPVELGFLYARRAPQQLSLDPNEAYPPKVREEAPSIKVAVDLPILRLEEKDLLKRVRAPTSSTEASRSIPSQPSRASSSAVAAGNLVEGLSLQAAQPALPSSHGYLNPRSEVMVAYLLTMEQFLDIQQEVMQSFLNGSNPIVHSGIGIESAESQQLPVGLGLSAEAPPSPGTHDSSPSVSAGPVKSVEVNANEELEGHRGIGQISPEAVSDKLLEIVSERTGYPTDMLDLTLNLEAELGIDSIKRVEILGALQSQTGILQVQDMEQVSTLRTLQEIIDFVALQLQGEQDVTMVSNSLQSREVKPSTAANGQPSFAEGRPTGWCEQSVSKSSTELSDFPLLGTITSMTPGQELIALRQIDSDEDLYLKDHTLGNRVSLTDEKLTGLPVVPLTISMEMLAEAAAALLPGKVVIGMKDIRAYRWLALEEKSLNLQLIARQTESTTDWEVKVRMQEVGNSSTSPQHPWPPIVEGTVVLGDDYPTPPRIGEFLLRSERSSKWTPEQLYKEGMFHGPSFQGVVSVDRWGEDGIEGTLKSLPSDRLFRSIPNPCFLANPVLLDAAGQLIGYWTTEHLERGFNVFPFRVEELRIYGLGLPRGELAKCRARTALIGDWQVRSDIDVIGPDGHLLAQLVGWEDRRFDLPDRFYRLRIAPRDVILSTPWPGPIAHLSEPDAFSCCILDTLSRDFLEAHGRIWLRVLAHLVLNRPEREIWQNLRGPEKRRIDWLLGRSAAKDAVRQFLMNRYGTRVCPADIEIGQDEHGRPLAEGSVFERFERVPIISLSHSDGIAAAVAGDDAECYGIGIDVECVNRLEEDAKRYTFTPEERELLSSLDSSLGDEWSVRLWCAKEAAAKALGRGIVGRPQDLVAHQLDLRTGTVRVALLGELAEEFPEYVGMGLIVHTGREGNLTFASSLLKGV